MKNLPSSILLVLTLLAPACLAGGAADRISVSDPYARAVPPGQTNSALFMTLTNASGEGHSLVAAESPVAEAVELHNHIMDGGMMRMRRVEYIDLEPGETVALEPGGLHLMLIGLSRQLQPGQQVDLTLVFGDGSRARLQAPVRRVTPGGGGGRSGRCGSGRCGSGRCGAGK
jgi:copper(I)-binding protein